MACIEEALGRFVAVHNAHGLVEFEADCGLVFHSFWQPLMLDGLRDQAVAEKVLDIAYYIGIPRAVAMLQTALNSLRAALSVNGNMSASVLAAANSVDPKCVLIELRALLLAHYHRLVEADPEKYRRNWDMWKARAEA